MATQTLAPLPARLGAATRPQRTACTPTRRHSCVLPRQRPCVVQASGGSGCCGGSGSSSASQGEAGQPAKEAGGCGCSGPSAPAATNGQDAASSVMHQLNSMMGGMEGSLTRDDFRAAFEAAAPRQDDAGGERFLDVHAILHTSGIGGDEDDEELDALVV